MAWTENLRPASFRGVPFKVEAHDAQGGRRTVKHEFPLRDKPYVEDMGRRAKDFSVDAYVVGDDYMQQRDALLRACDEPGSAELVHPYLGTLQVVCTGWALRESKSEGRMARFSLSFTESGEAAFPSDSIDAPAQADIAADAAKETAISDFERMFSIDGLPDFAVDDAVSLMTDAATSINDTVRSINSVTSGGFGFLGTVNRFIGSISSLLGTPGTLARDLFGLIDGASSLFDSPLSAVRGMFGLFNFGNDVEPIQTTTATRVRQQQNRNAIIGLVRQAAVIEAARNAPSAEYETAEDAEETRDKIADQLDSVMEDAATPDDTYTALQKVRAAVVRGVPPEDVALPNLVTVTPAATLPSLVLAYDIYEDAARESEIVTRNRIRHPGFVPGAEPLRVVTDA